MVEGRVAARARSGRRSPPRDLMVVGDDPDEGDVTEAGGPRVVDLDGEPVRLSPRTVTFPHPALLPDRDDLREFAAELGIAQGVEQLHRAVWRKPADLDARATQVPEFAGGRFPTRAVLAARATFLGHRVPGARAVRRVRDGAYTVEAAVRIGEVSTGPLTWHEPDGGTLRPAEVGSVAWSEGVRMAAALYAGRVIDEGTGA
ncbi:DUF4132 domain-containing protein [Streptomyces sp. 4F14]|uniref:DUF4132 domain-containing protein n=1 Tax=Streptomyces sp. 4F14 TaxID=3394380 RepID=UPI003A837116